MKMPESQHTTAQAIIQWHGKQPQDHRDHLGCSILGNACDRNVWLTWRWAKKPDFDGRMLRLFDTGKREEVRLIEELKALGIELYDVDPTTKDQLRVSACNGHLGGSLDGMGCGFPEAPKSWAVLECKTHNTRSFTELKAKGVDGAKPQHYAQMTLYMGLMGVERALYLAVCKETDDIYSEWVKFDQVDFDVLMRRAQAIIDATEPPPKVSQDPAHWVCKMCSFHALCHQQRVAEANCRTCCHASPVENGAWQCGQHNAAIDSAKQRKGCGDHLLIPALVPFAEPVDCDENFVEYKHKHSGKTFRNGAGFYSSAELAAALPEFITDPVVEEFKKEFDATIVGSSSALDGLDKICTKPEDLPVATKGKRVTKKFDMKALEALK